MTDTALSRDVRREAVEARVARRIAAALDESLAVLPHDIDERLRVARARALARAALNQSQAVIPVASGATVSLGGTPWWLKLASLAPIVLMLGGLILIDRLNELQQIKAAAEIDAVLLADDLPPTAYADPGFAEFLRQRQP